MIRSILVEDERNNTRLTYSKTPHVHSYSWNKIFLYSFVKHCKFYSVRMLIYIISTSTPRISNIYSFESFLGLYMYMHTIWKRERKRIAARCKRKIAKRQGSDFILDSCLLKFVYWNQANCASRILKNMSIMIMVWCNYFGNKWVEKTKSQKRRKYIFEEYC